MLAFLAGSMLQKENIMIMGVLGFIFLFFGIGGTFSSFFITKSIERMYYWFAFIFLGLLFLIL